MDEEHAQQPGETARAEIAEPPSPARPPRVGDLRRERRRLWDEREETVYHVGGLAVDLRRRGLDDAELVSRRADAVLAIDQRLHEVDTLLDEIDARRRGTRPAPAAGYCLSCGAPFQTEAAFCFRCGARVSVAGPSGADEVADAADRPTTVITDDGTDDR